MPEPKVPVGFDYAGALREILTKRSYSDVMRYLGYSSKYSVIRVLGGSMPAHAQGEAIYALYVSLFNKKPPMSRFQETGAYTDGHKIT